MELRRLGNSDIQTPPLVLGGNVFGWTVDEADSFRLLDRFRDAGFNFIDTANVYSRWKPGNRGGESEAIIGNWMKSRGNRSQVVIATKVGHEMDPERKGLKKSNILREAEMSLQRLQTDYIDLYQSHVDDLETPVEEALEAYAGLVKAGKVRAIGASNFSAERLTKSVEAARKFGFPCYVSLQPQYNLCERTEYESKLEATCVELGLGVIPYFGLARGFLTGKYRTEADLSKSLRGQGVKKYLNDSGRSILAALDKVSAETSTNPAQVALAWLIARPSITAPIASATSLEQLDDLIASTRLELTGDQIQRLNQASAYSR